MSDKIIWITPVEHDAPEVLGEALILAMNNNVENIMSCRSYMDKYSYPGAVAIIVNEDDDPKDATSWTVVILEKLMPIGSLL